MRKSLVVTTVVLVIIFLISGSPASAQELHKAYAITAGGHIMIQNVSGEIRVTGYNGDSVVVDAYPFGRDSTQVQVEDLSSGDRVELRVRYPEGCDCEAGVNFSVRVPAYVNYSFDRLGSVSGDIDVTGIRGIVRAASVSGDVIMKDVTGSASASSVSGSVDADLAGVDGAGAMKFSSVSGDVVVRIPRNSNADIEMSSLSGTLQTDFPIEVQEAKHGPGRSARGRVGTAENSFRVTSVSGNVSLTGR
jgi:hypothetical protein